MLRASQDYLLCPTYVLKERDKERRADESAVRNIINQSTNKFMQLELQKKINKRFHNKKKNIQEKLTIFLIIVSLNSQIEYAA